MPLRHALVVVTGASTGIGAATARELAKRGFHVLAGVRRDADADAIRSANVEPSRLDITNEAEIAMLVKRIADDPDRRPCAPSSTTPESRSTRPWRRCRSPSGAAC
jgi:NAD(P)-dependent dehydrogenase (short-subunit alcohol dehydrogenase family)